METYLTDNIIRHYHSTKKALSELHKDQVFYNFSESKLFNLTHKRIGSIELAVIFIIINIITADFKVAPFSKLLKDSRIFHYIVSMKRIFYFRQ